MINGRVLLCTKILLILTIVVSLFCIALCKETSSLQEFQELKAQIHKTMFSGQDNSELIFALRKLGYSPAKGEVIAYINTSLQTIGKKFVYAPTSKPHIMFSIVDLISVSNLELKIAELKDSYEQDKSLPSLVKLVHLLLFETKAPLDPSVAHYIDKLRENFPEDKFVFAYYSGLYALKTGSTDEARKYFLAAANETIDNYSQAEMLIRAATIYKQAGHAAEAVSTFSRAYELINDFSPLDNYLIRCTKLYDAACLDYAEVLNDQKNYWAAVYYFRKQPLNERSLTAMAELFLTELKNKTNARETIDQLKRVNPAKQEGYWKRFMKTNWEVEARYPIEKLLTR